MLHILLSFLAPSSIRRRLVRCSQLQDCLITWFCLLLFQTQTWKSQQASVPRATTAHQVLTDLIHSCWMRRSAQSEQSTQSLGILARPGTTAQSVQSSRLDVRQERIRTLKPRVHASPAQSGTTATIQHHTLSPTSAQEVTIARSGLSSPTSIHVLRAHSTTWLPNMTSGRVCHVLRASTARDWAMPILLGHVMRVGTAPTDQTVHEYVSCSSTGLFLGILSIINNYFLVSFTVPSMLFTRSD